MAAPATPLRSSTASRARRAETSASSLMREQPVHHDQQQDDEDFETDAHGRAYRGKLLHIGR